MLWADAICIDQNNIPERNQQVRIMRKIFSQADRVLSWLGPAADSSDLAFDFCNALEKGLADEILHMQTNEQSTKESSDSWTSPSVEEATMIQLPIIVVIHLT